MDDITYFRTKFITDTMLYLRSSQHSHSFHNASRNVAASKHKSIKLKSRGKVHE